MRVGAGSSIGRLESRSKNSRSGFVRITRKQELKTKYHTLLRRSINGTMNFLLLQAALLLTAIYADIAGDQWARGVDW